MPGLPSSHDFPSLLRAISLTDEPLNELEQLRSRLLSLKLEDSNIVSADLNLRVLFDCLNTSVQDQIDKSVDILARFLAVSSPSDILEYTAELKRVIVHPNEAVKLFVIFQVDRCVDNSEACQALISRTSLLEDIITCVGCDQTAVACSAVRVLKHLCSVSHAGMSSGWRLLFTPPLLDSLMAVKQLNDTVRYRVYEMAVETAVRGLDSLQLTADSGLLPALLQEAYGSDILVQLNALELLATLAQTEHGFDYLLTQDVMAKLDRLLSAPDDLQDFTLHGLVRFFSQLGHYRPECVLADYAGFRSRLYALVASADSAHRLCGLDALVCVAITPAGKMALSRQGIAMTDCLQHVGRMISSSPSEVRLRAIDTLHQLLRVKRHEASEELSAVTERWFAEICSGGVGSPAPVELIWSIARQPFQDLRMAALRVLTAVAEYDWGQQLLSQTAGFVEYLLDRSTETTQDGRMAKYSLVCAIVDSSAAGAAFHDDMRDRLYTYRHEGALYVRVQTDVALEEPS